MEKFELIFVRPNGKEEVIKRNLTEKQAIEYFDNIDNTYYREEQTMFNKGDIVQAKAEWLAPYETQEDTMGIVIDYNPDNDYLQVGVLNPQDYAFPPIFNGRGCCYEVVKKYEGGTEQ